MNVAHPRRPATLPVPKQWGGLAVLAIALLTSRHVPELAFVDFAHRPGPGLLGIFEETLVFLE